MLRQKACWIPLSDNSPAMLKKPPHTTNFTNWLLRLSTSNRQSWLKTPWLKWIQEKFSQWTLHYITLLSFKHFRLLSNVTNTTSCLMKREKWSQNSMTISLHNSSHKEATSSMVVSTSKTMVTWRALTSTLLPMWTQAVKTSSHRK